MSTTILPALGLALLRFFSDAHGRWQWWKREEDDIAVLYPRFLRTTDTIAGSLRTVHFVNPAFAAMEGTPAMSQKVTPAMLRNTASCGDRAAMPRYTHTPGIAELTRRTDMVPAKTTPARRFRSAGGAPLLSVEEPPAAHILCIQSFSSWHLRFL